MSASLRLPDPWGRLDAVPVVERADGTRVHRIDGDRPCYVKSAPARSAEDLRFHAAGEARRLEWLAGQGLPVPEVIDSGEDGGAQWLVTAAVPGQPAGAAGWTPSERDRAVDAVAAVAVALHALPVEDCPFDRRLASSLPRARRAARSGVVDLDDVEPHHLGCSADALLAELDSTPAPAERRLAVCHGDLTLANVLVDPRTLETRALIDVGRLGVADPWLDLSVVLRDIGEEQASSGFGAEHANRFMRRYGLGERDPERDRFYRLLDEFC